MTSSPAGVLDRRRAGVLLHATSLPDARHGALGSAARSFVDWLADAGFTVWQLLPLGPVGADRSPYYARSNHAGDPALIDLEEFVRAGLIEPGEADSADRAATIGRAAARLREQGGEGAAAFAAFGARAAGWLGDYALFTAIQAREQGRPWWEWPEALKRRDAAALDNARRELAAAAAAVVDAQYFFHAQYERLRAYARERGVHLFGDIPIYVAPDSVEVWSHPELFELDGDGRPTAVAGVPPDYFSSDGQRWGNPLFRWDEHERTGFAWWIERLSAQFELFDLVRIDHFRGLESYWAVPATAPTAAAGEWRPAPGRALLARALEVFGRLEVVAEDLGVITPEVERLRDDFGLPGMRVAQFGFDGNSANIHLPHNWVPRSIAYTGTHDNDTTVGWFAGLDATARAEVRDYLAAPEGQEAVELTRAVLGSVATLAVVPMQDLLGLGRAARMNTPGTTVGNWTWSFAWADVPTGLSRACRRVNELYGRASRRGG